LKEFTRSKKPFVLKIIVVTNHRCYKSLLFKIRPPQVIVDEPYGLWQHEHMLVYDTLRFHVT